MTRKNYEAIAEVFRTHAGARVAGEPNADAEHMRRVLAIDMAANVARFNSEFDRKRFLAACAAD